MSIGLDSHAAERILFVRFIPPVNPEEDMLAAIQAIKDFHDQVQSEFFAIVDAR
jgi:hypothetical protein